MKRNTGINLGHLEYFYWVAKLGGVTAAAAQLNTSQPSISAQIKVFEAEHNVCLFQKFGRGVILTEQGKELFDVIEEMFEVQLENAKYLLDKFAGITDKPKPIKQIYVPTDDSIYVDQHGRKISIGGKI